MGIPTKSKSQNVKAINEKMLVVAVEVGKTVHYGHFEKTDMGRVRGGRQRGSKGGHWVMVGTANGERRKA
jgi:hypothetical protein